MKTQKGGKSKIRRVALDRFSFSGELVFLKGILATRRNDTCADASEESSRMCDE